MNDFAPAICVSHIILGILINNLHSAVVDCFSIKKVFVYSSKVTIHLTLPETYYFFF